MAQRQRQRQELAKDLLARLRNEQAELARQAAQMAARVGAEAPQQTRIEAEAARQAARASHNVKRNDLPAAARNAEQAGQKLGQLSDRLAQ